MFLNGYSQLKNLSCPSLSPNLVRVVAYFWNFIFSSFRLSRRRFHSAVEWRVLFLSKIIKQEKNESSMCQNWISGKRNFPVQTLAMSPSVDKVWSKFFFRNGNRFAVMKRRLIKIPILTWSCIFVLRLSFKTYHWTIDSISDWYECDRPITVEQLM